MLGLPAYVVHTEDSFRLTLVPMEDSESEVTWQPSPDPAVWYKNINHRIPDFGSIFAWNMTEIMPYDPRMLKKLKALDTVHTAEAVEEANHTIPDGETALAHEPLQNIAGLDLRAKSAAALEPVRLTDSDCPEEPFLIPAAENGPKCKPAEEVEQPWAPLLRKLEQEKRRTSKRYPRTSSANSQPSFFRRQQLTRQNAADRGASLESDQSFGGTRRGALFSPASTSRGQKTASWIGLPTKRESPVRFRDTHRCDARTSGKVTTERRGWPLDATGGFRNPDRSERRRSRDRTDATTGDRHRKSSPTAKKRKKSKSRSRSRSPRRKHHSSKRHREQSASPAGCRENPSPSADRKKSKSPDRKKSKGKSRKRSRSRSPADQKSSRRITYGIKVSKTRKTDRGTIAATSALAPETLKLDSAEGTLVVEFPVPSPVKHLSLGSLARDIESRLLKSPTDDLELSPTETLSGFKESSSLAAHSVDLMPCDSAFEPAKDAALSLANPELNAGLPLNVPSESMKTPIMESGATVSLDKGSLSIGSILNSLRKPDGPFVDPDELSRMRLALDPTEPISSSSEEGTKDVVEPDSAGASVRLEETPLSGSPMIDIFESSNGSARRKLQKSRSQKTTIKIMSRQGRLEELFNGKKDSQLTLSILEDYMGNWPEYPCPTEVPHVQAEFDNMLLHCGGALQYLEHFLDQSTSHVEKGLLQRGICSLFLQRVKLLPQPPPPTSDIKPCCCELSLGKEDAGELQILPGTELEERLGCSEAVCAASVEAPTGTLSGCSHPADKSAFYYPQGVPAFLCGHHVQLLISHQMCPCGVFPDSEKGDQFVSFRCGHLVHRHCFARCPHKSCWENVTSLPEVLPHTTCLIVDEV